MTTVAPANMTALPAVASARDIDSAGVQALGELGSVARQEEQRVVDADGEAEHLGQRGRVLETVTHG